MITSNLVLETAQARDYLAQLSDHFAKRVPVDTRGDFALVILPIGSCALTASDARLSAVVKADAAEIDRMEEVFGGWIERLAFREQPHVTWQRVALNHACET